MSTSPTHLSPTLLPYTTLFRSVRLEYREESARRQQLVLLFAKAHEDFQVLVVHFRRFHRHDRQAIQREQVFLQRLGEVPGSPEPRFDVEIGRASCRERV